MTTFPPPAPSPLISPHDYGALLRGDLVAFIHRAFCDLNPQTLFMAAPYIELMASHLEDCRSGKSRRLIINLPPRSLKSHCVSIAFAAWLLGHNPATQIIAASYGQDLADKLARDTRTLMEADWYRALFPTRLSARKAVNDFTTTAGGTRRATSVGGGADRPRRRRHRHRRSAKAGSGALRRWPQGGQRMVRQHAALPPQQQTHRLHHHRHAALASGRPDRPRTAAGRLDGAVLPGNRRGAGMLAVLDALRDPAFHPSARRSPPSGPGGGG